MDVGEKAFQYNLIVCLLLTAREVHTRTAQLRMS